MFSISYGSLIMEDNTCKLPSDKQPPPQEIPESGMCLIPIVLCHINSFKHCTGFCCLQVLFNWLSFGLSVNWNVMVMFCLAHCLIYSTCHHVYIVAMWLMFYHTKSMCFHCQAKLRFYSPMMSNGTAVKFVGLHDGTLTWQWAMYKSIGFP